MYIYRSECKVPFILCQVLTKLEFSGQIFEKMLKHEISSHSVQWETNCYIRTDRQTDRKKVTVAFHNFPKVPKNQSVNVV